MLRPGPNSPRTIWWPERFVRFDDVDVFHGPHNLLPRKLRGATVVTIHDLMALDEPALHLQGIERLVKRAYYPQAIWRALRHATRLIAVSKATADRIIAHVPDAAKRLVVIREATEDYFRPAVDVSEAKARAAKLLGGDWPYLLLLGANVPSKRHDLAMVVFANAVAEPWRLVVVQRRRAQRSPAGDRIVQLRGVTRDEVITLLQCAGALIQPSLYEGFGLPVLEGMACGCPVVASDIAPFREITEGAALLVAPGNADALAVGLRTLLDSPLQSAELRERGLAQAKKFSWDRCARETLEVYHDAAKAGRVHG